ncbi:hypothetical protein Taro_029150 [Colocasia esculenta]|uniref:Glycosyl transferase CAP10 domain-containing protein n=1 Tax=Colocasia esculenta TaxID=4460 RepID=A0A843VSH3_COLES|nr:hypothetical protein [Colocasia esculenta]
MKQQISYLLSLLQGTSMQCRRAGGILLFSFLLFVGVFLSSLWFDMSMISSSFGRGRGGSRVRLTCPPAKEAAQHTCPSPPPPLARPTTTGPAAAPSPPPPPLCPTYFQWIHEDLRPWSASGITREMMEREKENANFRLVVLGGRAYVEKYGRRTFQTRDLFTQWGILQLLRRYPGRVPDLELMFDCSDFPAVAKAAHQENAPAPAPLFGYCSDNASLDIVFPDWSFWGWPEVNIEPWEPLMKEVKEGNRRVRWVDREPYAYWKGNPWVASWRQDLLKCNVSSGQDWNARLYVQDWISENKQKFMNSALASQCKHRYKIYIEGAAWSVSQKYILGCDSPTLRVNPRYYDFFSRGLLPLRHYWPVKAEEGHKCSSIKFAVDWGNAHQDKAQEIGKAGSGFTEEELKMDYVYDYMLHLLTEYAKLLRFKPTKPPAAVELCTELMACPAGDLEREFMVLSMADGPRHGGPCTLPPPFTPSEMKSMMSEVSNSTGQVELWESKTD